MREFAGGRDALRYARKGEFAFGRGKPAERLGAPPEHVFPSRATWKIGLTSELFMVEFRATLGGFNATNNEAFKQAGWDPRPNETWEALLISSQAFMGVSDNLYDNPIDAGRPYFPGVSLLTPIPEIWSAWPAAGASRWTLDLGGPFVGGNNHLGVFFAGWNVVYDRRLRAAPSLALKDGPNYDLNYPTGLRFDEFGGGTPAPTEPPNYSGTVTGNLNLGGINRTGQNYPVYNRGSGTGNTGGPRAMGGTVSTPNMPLTNAIIGTPGSATAEELMPEISGDITLEPVSSPELQQTEPTWNQFPSDMPPSQIINDESTPEELEKEAGKGLFIAADWRGRHYIPRGSGIVHLASQLGRHGNGVVDSAPVVFVDRCLTAPSLDLLIPFMEGLV